MMSHVRPDGRGSRKKTLQGMEDLVGRILQKEINWVGREARFYGA